MSDSTLNDPSSLDTSPMSSRYYAPAEGRIHVSGLFDTRDEAEKAVARLVTLGVDRSFISVILRDDPALEIADTSTADTSTLGTHAGEAAGRGTIVGGSIGAVVGAIVAAGTSIIIPGIGLILGPIAGALAGAGAGGIAGGVVGALSGAGVPEETARAYHTGLEAGGVVVIADVPAALQDEARVALGGIAH